MAGLLGAAATGLGRLFGAQTDAPTPQIAQLDPATQEMINASMDRSMRPTSEYAADLNKNVMAASQAAGRQAPSDQGGTAYADPAMTASLRQAFNTQSGRAVSSIVDRNNMNAEFHRADYMRRMAHTILGQQQAMIQSNQMMVDSYNQSEMARAGLISSLFQLGGTAIAIGAAKHKTKPQEQEITTGQATTGGFAPDMSEYGSNYGDVGRIA